MRYLDEISLGEMIEHSKELISFLGVDLQSGHDFEIFKFHASESEKETPLDPIFDPVQSDLDCGSGMWLIGKNRQGEVIQTQAIRSLNLEGKTFAEYLDKHIADIRPDGYDVDVKNTKWRLSNKAAAISGNVLYHGGLWIHKDFRGGSLASLVTRYMLALAISKLQPDYFVGLQSPRTSCRGLAAREGYMNQEQRSIVWSLKDQEGEFEDWLVWMDREDAEFNLTVPPANLFEMFEKSMAPKRQAAEESKAA